MSSDLTPERRPDRYDEDDQDDDRPRRRGVPDVRKKDTELTTGDWLLCIFCSGIGCLIGLVRLIQGKPNAGMMIGISLMFSFLWRILITIIEVAARQQP